MLVSVSERKRAYVRVIDCKWVQFLGNLCDWVSVMKNIFKKKQTTTIKGYFFLAY